MEDRNSIISLLNKERKYYEMQQRYHYLTFAVYVLILIADFLVIIFTRLQTLNGYAWAGIIFLLVLISVEARQYYVFKELKENVDEFYLRGAL